MTTPEIINQIQVFREKLEKEYPKCKSAQAIKSHTEALLYLNMLEDYYRKMK